MRRLRILWPVLPGALILLTYGASYVAGRVAGPAARTRCFFTVLRGWSAHWPFESGKYMPALFFPTVQPLAKTWVQVEPHVTMLLDPQDCVSRVILESGVWEPGSQQIVAEHLG